MISPEEYKILKTFAQRIPTNDPGAHNNLAVVYYNKGLYDEAIEELEKALQIDPNFLLARNNLDIILKKSGRLDEKVKELYRKVEVEPFDENKTLELANAYRGLNRYAQAIIFYKKVLAFNPGSYEAHFGLGTTLKSLGKYDEALEELKKALEIKISAEGYRLLAEIYLNKAMLDLAIKNFQESLLLDPSSAEAHFFLGFALGEKGKHKEAIEEVRKAIAINPALAQLEPNLPIELEDHKGYWEFLKEGLGVPKTSVNEYEVHYNLGVTYLNKGLFTEAKREFEECLKFNSGDAELFVSLGEVNIFLNKLDDAIKNFERGLELDFSSPRCANGLGIVYLKKNDYPKAIFWFEKSLASKNDFAPALNNLAVAQLCQNRVEETIKNYEKALGLGNLEAKFNLGSYYFKRGDYEGALKLFKDDTADDNFMRGLVYAEIGRDEEALAAFKKTTSIAPNYVDAHYNIGFLLMKLGKYEEGLSFIRQGMQIEPNYEKDKYRLSIAPEFYEYGPYYSPKITKEMLIEEIEGIFSTLEEPKPEAYLADAEKLFQKKDFKKALELTQKVLKLNPDFKPAIILKAKILFQDGNIDEAVALLSSYQNVHPADTEILVTLAEIFGTIGKLEPAKEAYSKLLNLQPENTHWLIKLAEITYSLNELDESLKIWKKIYEKNNRSAVANLGLLKIYLKKKELDTATPYLNFLEKEHPEVYEFNLCAGIYWLEKGDRQKTENYLHKAINLDPSKSLSYYYLGLLQVQKGEFNNATDNWKKALLLSPTGELAEKIGHCLRITMEMLEFLKSASATS